MPLAAVLAIAHHTRSGRFVAGLPHALQSALVVLLGARPAKVRGYDVRLP